MSDYYNTNNETGETLAKSRDRAKTQQDSILAFFMAHPNDHFSPDFIALNVLPEAPLTSVRRAITNLTSEGKLDKTDTMTMGRYGKKVHTWRLNKT